jgi:hypothetical protein
MLSKRQGSSLDLLGAVGLEQRLVLAHGLLDDGDEVLLGKDALLVKELCAESGRPRQP